VTVVMAATQIRRLAIKNDDRFKDTTTGRLALTYTAVTGMTIEADSLA
jgi:hypothetical protein